MKTQNAILALVMMVMVFPTVECYLYTVETYTSSVVDSETDDYIYISMYGTKSAAVLMEIDNEDNNFEKGKKDTFYFYMDRDLGDIHTIKLEKTGSNGWRCDKVIIKGRNGSYTFLVNKWFDNEEGYQLSGWFNRL